MNQDNSQNTTRLGVGSLLVANPLLTESHFFRSALMIVDINTDKGALGLTLNKLSTLHMSDILKEWEDVANMPVYNGGPVDPGRLFMLHTLGEVIGNSFEICPGLYIGNNYADAFRYIDLGGETDGRLRFFLGYSGWTAGQLEAEITSNAWAVTNPTDGRGLLRGNEEDYWRREVKELGNAYRPWLLMPEDPNLN